MSSPPPNFWQQQCDQQAKSRRSLGRAIEVLQMLHTHCPTDAEVPAFLRSLGLSAQEQLQLMKDTAQVVQAQLTLYALTCALEAKEQPQPPTDKSN